MRSRVVWILFFCLVAGVTGQAGTIFAADDGLMKVSITGYTEKTGDYLMDITTEWFPEDTRAILIYSEPSHTLRYALVDLSLPIPELNKIQAEKPEILDITNIDLEYMDLNGILTPVYDNGIVVERLFEVGKKIGAETLSETWIEADGDFSIVMVKNEGKIPGCYMQGQCNDHPIEGHWCVPCISVLCCYGDIGYIVCGMILCP